MCFSANMSLGMGMIGVAASAITYLDKNESFWVRVARAYPIFHFSLMEFIQYFAYPVADQCGYGTNLLLSQLSTYHISLQAIAIMPALASYSSDPNAMKKAAYLGSAMSAVFLICDFLPAEWQFYEHKAEFIGNLVSCLYMGIYHISYSVRSAFGMLATQGLFFALALSAFVWKDNKKIGTYHFVMAMFTLYVPQWFFKVTVGEAAAMYCFYSIPITVSFMPYFKNFFSAQPQWERAAETR